MSTIEEKAIEYCGGNSGADEMERSAYVKGALFALGEIEDLLERLEREGHILWAHSEVNDKIKELKKWNKKTN